MAVYYILQKSSIVDHPRWLGSKYTWFPSVKPRQSNQWNFSAHFNPMFHFYTLWKHQQPSGFPKFSGGIEFTTYSGGKEMEHWAKMG